MTTRRYSNAGAIWALGITQIVGYGTLYYSFPVLAPDIAAEFGVAIEWIYGFLSLALLAGGLISPYAGGLADKHGAARVLTIGSVAAAVSLIVCALSGTLSLFISALVMAELASAFVLYPTAFALLVQTTGAQARRSITYLTLIAGFASTIFWPATTWMLQSLDWYQVYLVFAGMHALICLPLHLWLTRFTRDAAQRPVEVQDAPEVEARGGSNATFVLVVVGFALAGFVSAATLFHIVPLLGMLGLGASGVLVAALFGPAQVAARLANMALGKNLAGPALALISAVMMPAALVVLALTAPLIAGSVAFAIIFGLGTGLFSIVSGTLPLALFGKSGFGRRLGWISLGRLSVSAAAPFALSVTLGVVGARPSVWLLAGAGVACVAVFGEIWRRAKATQRGRLRLPSQHSEASAL